MKCRSEARFTFGITSASKFGAWRIVERSESARPEETAFMRTLSSVMFGGRGVERKDNRLVRADAFWEGVTESSRS
jgi:hypothetical protein